MQMAPLRGLALPALLTRHSGPALEDSLVLKKPEPSKSHRPAPKSSASPLSSCAMNFSPLE